VHPADLDGALQLSWCTASGWRRIDRASAHARCCARGAHVGALYDSLCAAGLQYGPGYRTVTHAWGGKDDASARFRSRSSREGTQVHPADLDDALCTSAIISSSRGGGSEARLPFAIDDALLQGVPGDLWAVRHFQCTTPMPMPHPPMLCALARRLVRRRAPSRSRCGLAP
jgi:hypothetical protein